MGVLTLPASGPVYLDANCFIYSVERIEPYRTLLESVWIAGQAGQIEIVSSELALLETVVKPLRANDQLLISLFRSLLSSREVKLIPADRRIWEDAAQLRATFGMKTPDAIHAATAISVGTRLFLTNDAGFRRVTMLPCCILSEVV